MIVIGELHNHQTEPAHDFNQSNLVFDRRAVLSAKDNPNATLGFCARDVTRFIDGTNEIGHGLEALIPLAKARQCLFGILVVGDRDVNAVQTPGAHLFKNVARPRRVLQTIDDRPILIHNNAPDLCLDITRFHRRVELTRTLTLFSRTKA